jgi:tetratricopeptide (TPR) repeat protein
MDNMEFIEAWFNAQLSPERKKEFEQRITTDPAFAEETAFYLSLRQGAAHEMMEERERFKPVYEQYKRGVHTNKPQPVMMRKLWPWVAAAAVMAGIIFGWNAWLTQASPDILADKYVKEHFQTLSVTMGNNQDSLQAGLRLYNEGRHEEALKQFETMAQNDTSFIEAKKYAGIISLRLGQYDKAINWFSQLENYTQLYANPGKFYHALTLLERNLPGDKETAKSLLQQVVEKDLEGREVAEKWLREW